MVGDLTILAIGEDGERKQRSCFRRKRKSSMNLNQKPTIPGLRPGGGNERFDIDKSIKNVLILKNQ